MQTIKTAAGGMILLVASLSLYAVYKFAEANQENMRRVGSNMADALTVLIWAGAVSATILLVGGAAWLIWHLFAKSRHEQIRQRDGSWALQKYRTNGMEIIVDPNRMVGPTMAIIPQTGAVVQHTPAAGWTLQQQYNQAVQVTRSIEAAAPGDRAIAHKYGSMYRGARALTAGMIGKMAQGGRAPAGWEEPPALPETEEPAPEHKISLPQLMSTATPTNWPIGYDPATGEIASVRPGQHQHVLIVGATGKGKTKSSAFQIAAHALRSDWHVIVLDGKGGLDWRSFERHAEWHEADASTIAEQAVLLLDLYRSRQQIVRSHGVSQWSSIPAGERGPFVLLIIEELGAIMAGLRTRSVKEYGDTERMLSGIIARSRAVGLHFMAVTTSIKDWPSAFRDNSDLKIAYRLGENQGAAISLYDKEVERLHPGEFKIAGEPGRFRAFNLEHDLARLLPAPKEPVQMLPVVRPEYEEDWPQEPPQDEETPQHSPPPAQQAQGRTTTSQRSQVAMDEQTARQAAMRLWMSERTPEELEQRGAQAELGRYLESIGLPTAKSHVSETWREILGQGPTKAG